MKTLLFLPVTLAVTTCQDYIDVLDKQFCKDRPDGNYPVNDDSCSLFYNCWQGQTFCQSCPEQKPYTPVFVYREDDWGLCATVEDPAIVCPTPGFPDNAKNDRPEITTVEPTSAPEPTNAPEPTETPVPSNFTTCDANKDSFKESYCMSDNYFWRNGLFRTGNVFFKPEMAIPRPKWQFRTEIAIFKPEMAIPNRK